MNYEIFCNFAPQNGKNVFNNIKKNDYEKYEDNGHRALRWHRDDGM